jgi:Zn finger protein HypA/HybF involved in hydrogenase expression
LTIKRLSVPCRLRVDAFGLNLVTYKHCGIAPEAPAQIIFMPEGYCVKCKAKKEIAEAVEETMKNGRKAIKGKCPTCGVVMFKILGGKAAVAAPAATKSADGAASPSPAKAAAPAPAPAKPTTPSS